MHRKPIQATKRFTELFFQARLSSVGAQRFAARLESVGDKSSRLLGDHGRIGAHADNVLVVSSTHGFTAKWLATRLYRFAIEHPEIDARVSSSFSVADFAADGVDVAIRILARAKTRHDGLIIEKLIEYDYIPVCSPSLLDQHGPIFSARDLIKLPLIHDESADDISKATFWETWFREMGVKPGKLSGTPANPMVDNRLMRNVRVQRRSRAERGTQPARELMKKTGAGIGLVVGDHPDEGVLAADDPVTPGPADEPESRGGRVGLESDDRFERIAAHEGADPGPGPSPDASGAP